MRRNLENTNGLAQASYKEILEIKKHLSAIEHRLEAISTQVHRSTFQTLMTGCDLSEFFPVETNKQLELFMDRQHPDWESRKIEFYHYLYTISSQVRKGFARGLLKAIFSRKYIVNVKWPRSG